MNINLKDYAEQMQDVAPQVRDVLESIFQEASRVISPASLQTYMEGTKA